MKLPVLLLAVGIALSASTATARSLSVDLGPAADNPSSPQMGDHLSFHTIIRNTGKETADGLIAWISLVRIDKGREQPVDLEDWSAHKAVAASTLEAGQSIETDWPMRLIQSGNYRVVVSAVSHDSGGLIASPFADFSVRPKAVVESWRVLPAALGIPLLIGAAMLWRRQRLRKPI